MPILVSSISLSLSPASYGQQELPEIGSAGTSALSIEKEKVIGKVLMKQVRSQRGWISDPLLDEYINDLGNRLVRYSEEGRYNFNFFLINQSDINAFAFFGGNIGVHTGLILQTRNESELASVLAHEIAHVTQRHLARSIEAKQRSAPLTMAGVFSSILLTLINPQLGIAALNTTVAGQAQAGINYTRSNEKEADRVGIATLAKAGFDPQGAPDFFGRLAAASRYTSKPPAMLLTHPLPTSRVTDARLRADQYSINNPINSKAFHLARVRLDVRFNLDAKAALDKYQARIKKDPDATLNQYGMALALFANRDYTQAQQYLEKLIANAPRDLFYLDLFADVMLAQKKYPEALKKLAKANDLMPNNQVVTLNYANALIEAGQPEEAAEVLKSFIIVKGEHYLGYDLLTQAYKKAGDKSKEHATKAELLVMLGGYQNAIDELQTAYNFAKKEKTQQKRILARINQLRNEEERIKKLSI